MELIDSNSRPHVVAGLPIEPTSAGSGDPRTTGELIDFNSPSLNETSTRPMPCCVRLCCKSMTYRDDERPGLLHWSDTQTYWCNLTMDPLGPDDRAATPKVCQPGRTCFVADE